MAYTTFANEELLYKHPNGEVLVKAVTAMGAELVAVTKDGFRTDYPKWDGRSSFLRWDNPEWFTKAFKERAFKVATGMSKRAV